MYGQMTAGSWIYIGSQGIVQGTYETFSAVAEKLAAARAARRHGGAGLAGTLTVTAGLRRDGRRATAGRHHERRRGALHRVRPGPRAAPGDHPLPRRAGRHPRRGHRSRARPPKREQQGALRRRDRQRRRGAARAAAPRRRDRHRHRPDQRARPAGLPADRGERSRTGTTMPPPSRRSSPTGPGRRWPPTSRRWSGSRTPAPRSSTTATPSAARRNSAGYDRAFDFPGFVPAYIRPLFCEGKGPFRWAALSGDPADIHATDEAVRGCSRTTTACSAGCAWPRNALPSRGFRPGSAGSARASGTRPGWSSTTWSPPVSCRRRW